MLLPDTFVRNVNRYAASGTPFLFLINYAATRCLLYTLPRAQAAGVLFDIDGTCNYTRPTPSAQTPLRLIPHPEPFEAYRRRFEVIQEGLRRGDSFLANLSLRTPVEPIGAPEQLFHAARALYKIYLPGRFVCFSPEIFVRISSDGIISSHPMKGTIDATIPDARAKILADPKEAAEHATITDLIRNDLSRVASGVHVARYRYIDEIRTRNGALLQVSSQVSGTLPADWRDHLGEILSELLPAGSISGAPKAATVRLIARAEQHDRGFYTGICGLFNGSALSTGVLIRFLEQTPAGEYFFHSGGGITIHSDCLSEYREVMEKIYIPV